MKKLFVVLFTLLFAMPAFAIDSSAVTQAGFSKLSPTDQAKIIQATADLVDKSATGPVAAPEKVEKWVNLGASIGKGLAGAAKELGVAVNEFAKTPVGEMTMFLILWHFLAGPVIHLVGGLLVWIIGFSFTFSLVQRNHTYRITYDDKGKVKEKTRAALSADSVVAFWFANAAVTLLGIAVIFTW